MWLDHWGSTQHAGQTCFVSEPYQSFPPLPEHMATPHELAVATDCRLLILRESEWNPPATIRLLFVPNAEDAADGC